MQVFPPSLRRPTTLGTSFMGILWLLDLHRSLLYFVLLLLTLGLTFWEAREQGYDRRLTLWWLSVVAMAHVPAYIALRGWVAWQKRSAR